MVSKEQLSRIAQHATAENLERYCVPLNEAMAKFAIDNPKRVTAFVAQIAHESNHFAAVSENLNYSAKGLLATFPGYFYARQTVAILSEAQKTEREKTALLRATGYAYQPEKIANYVYGYRMGNREAGDGWKFRGRGLIGITGKDNYALCGKGIGADLVTDPSKLELPLFATMSAAWFWSWRGLNGYADHGDLNSYITITKRINGGTIGLESRVKFWEQAKLVLS